MGVIKAVGRSGAAVERGRGAGGVNYTMSSAGANTEITNFFDCTIEALECLQEMEQDDATGKQDVVDSMRSRLTRLIPKILTQTHFSATTVDGWATDTLA